MKNVTCDTRETSPFHLGDYAAATAVGRRNPLLPLSFLSLPLCAEGRCVEKKRKKKNGKKRKKKHGGSQYPNDSLPVFLLAETLHLRDPEFKPFLSLA